MSMTVRLANATTVLLMASTCGRFVARKFPVAGAAIAIGTFAAAGVTAVGALIMAHKEF